MSIVYVGARKDGTRVSVHQRNDGYHVFVGGWRVAVRVTLQAALKRAEREESV